MRRASGPVLMLRADIDLQSVLLCKLLMFTSGSLKLTSGASLSGSGLLVTSCDQ